MFLFIIALLVVSNLTESHVPLTRNLIVKELIRQKRVVGGKDADIKDFPYQVDIEYNEFHHCGGTIVSKNYVLTASHCVQNRTIEDLLIRCGTSLSGIDGSEHSVADMIVHPQYYLNEHGNTNNDIALIRVKEPFVYSENCKSVSLNERIFSKNFVSNESAIVTGWGWSQFDEKYDNFTAINELQSLSVPLVNKSSCNRFYEKFGGIYDGQICAGYKDVRNKDVCYGDSGSPLTWNGKVIGIAAYIESKCGQLDYPSVYTEVAYFIPWIKKYVELN